MYKTNICMPMKFSQVDSMVKQNILYTFVAMEIICEIIMMPSVVKIQIWSSSNKVFSVFLIVSFAVLLTYISYGIWYWLNDKKVNTARQKRFTFGSGIYAFFNFIKMSTTATELPVCRFLVFRIIKFIVSMNDIRRSFKYCFYLWSKSNFISIIVLRFWVIFVQSLFRNARAVITETDQIIILK